VVLGLLAAGSFLGTRMAGARHHQFQRDLVSRPEAHLIAIGNSVIAAGFDPAAFTEACPQVGPSFNAGLGAAGLSQWYVAWRLAIEGRNDVRHVVIGAFDHLLTSPGNSHWSTWHSNDALAFFAAPEWTERFASYNSADQALYQIARLSPLFTERGAMWSKVELLRRQLGEIGMPTKNSSTTRFGRASDASLVLDNALDHFRSECRVHTSGSLPLAPQILEILKEAQQKGIKTMVVMMPLPVQRHNFYKTIEWRNYLDHLKILLKEKRCALIDATLWAADENLFQDSVHLNEAGSALFSQRLGHVMAESSK
jgi:hypothetical protein